MLRLKQIPFDLSSGIAICLDADKARSSIGSIDLAFRESAP
jgi:hypothetical protein